VLGAAETVVGLTDEFKPMADKRGLYRPYSTGIKSDGNIINFTATRTAMAGGGR